MEPGERGMDAGVGRGGGPAPEPWRDNVRRGMLTVAALIAPPVVIVSLVFGSGPRSWVDDAVLVATGALLPICRFLPGTLRLRSLLLLAISCTTSIYLLARIGLVAGISVSLATFSVLALISASRRVAFAIIATSAIAYYSMGLLASQRVLHLTAQDTDPYRLRNWVRMGTTSSLLAVLLTTVIDFVIRQVEAGARAVSAREKDLRIAYDRLGQLHGKLEATKEEERRSLSRELHDELGQTLTALKLRLQLGARAGEPAPGGEARDERIALVDDLISRVRKISVDLRPPLLDEVGLVSALRVYLDGQAALSGLPIALEAAEPAEGTPRLPADTEIACFRVVQESITNALRHAAASRLHVRISRTGQRLRLSIRDDGRGFDPGTLDEVAARGHLGVVGMRERIRARGGRFELRSTPGGGTVIEVELDVSPAPAAGSSG